MAKKPRKTRMFNAVWRWYASLPLHKQLLTMTEINKLRRIVLKVKP